MHIILDFYLNLSLQFIFLLSFLGVYLKTITLLDRVFSMTVASTRTKLLSTKGLPKIVKSLPPTKRT